MTLFHFTVLSILFYSLKCTFNLQPSQVIVAHSSAQGRSLKISTEEDLIAVGFDDGTAKLFNFAGLQICSIQSNNMSEIVQIIWSASFGPITLDAMGSAIQWSKQCVSSNEFIANDTAIRMSCVQFPNADDATITDSFIALNLQSSIQEYLTETAQYSQSYQPQGSQSFIEVIHSTDGSTLFASTDSSFVRIYNRGDTTQTQYSFITSSPVQKMAKIQGTNGEVVFGLTSNSQIYRFSSLGQSLYLGAFTPSSSIIICPKTKQIALAQTLSQTIGVYLFNGYKQQTLGGMIGYSQQLDSSNQYLVSIDDKGNLNIFTYQSFKTYIIAIIAGVAAGVFGLVIGVIVFIKLKKKWAQQALKGMDQRTRGRKYMNRQSGSKVESMNMLHNTTLQTTMR